MGPFRNKRLFLPLLLSIKHAASVSLSQFQQIAGFSDSCMAVWTETIPGCTTRDFGKHRTCSAVCVAGLDIISEEVKRACHDAHVDSDTLLGQFLQGSGVSILCPNVDEASTTTETTFIESTSQTQPFSAEPASTNSQPASQTAETTTTTTSTTQTTSQEQTSTASPQPTAAATSISATSTSTSSSVTSTTPSPSTLEISIGATTGTITTTNTEQSRASRTTSSAASSTTNIEAKGFGGVGDAFNILGNDASQSKQLSQLIVGGLVAGAVLMAGAMW